MSLSSSLNIAGNALFANQIGLQVTGNNIANANTPGYVREELVLAPAPTQRLGRLTLGLGVEVAGIVQKIDRFLESRLRGAGSDAAGAQAQVDAYAQLEALVGELNDGDLSTSLDKFFNSIHDVLADPASDSVRNLVALRGETLTQDVQRLSSRVRTVRVGVNDQLAAAAENINRLTAKVAGLNVQIASAEASTANNSDAVGLRDSRKEALDSLARLIDIEVNEQGNGEVNVLHQGEFLVSEGSTREVEVQFESDRGLGAAYLQLSDTQTRLTPTGGEVAGLTTARDDVLGGFLDDLDSLVGSLAFEFNRVFSSGQGLSGYRELTSANAVNDVTVALDAAGLPFTPTNGGFDLEVFDRQTGLTRTTRITVNLDGLGTDTSLTDLAASIDAVSGVSASVSSTGKLELSTDSNQLELAFGNDTSSLLAALGVNTFFTGSTASDFGVNASVADDPAKFAASRNGVGEDTLTAVDLADFLDQPLETRDGATLANLYDRLVNGVTQGSAVARSVAEGLDTFEQSLNSQFLAVSGVSLDEEAIRLIQYQRAFQANARVISTVSQLFDILVNL